MCNLNSVSSDYSLKDFEKIHKSNMREIKQANKGLKYQVTDHGWFIEVTKFTRLVTKYLDGDGKPCEYMVIL